MASSIFVTPGIGTVAAGAVNFDGDLTISGAFTAGGGQAGDFTASSVGLFGGVSRALWATSADGFMKVQNNGGTVSNTLKLDALPTIGAGFGGSPSVVTGSTAFAGRIDPGTGGAAVTGTLTFGGAAYAAAPSVTCSWSLGSGVTTAVATVSGINFSTSVAWPTGCIISYHCISS